MTAADSEAGPSTSYIKRYRPYFPPDEVERLSAKQRGKLSAQREERGRQQACGFIDAVGVRSGFPRRTIATAQTLYMRFHLFFPHKDFNYLEVALSALYVSTKLYDTLKRSRDLILTSYALRLPHLVKKGAVDVAAVDPKVLEGERRRFVSIERLLLESMCFRFEARTAFDRFVPLAQSLGLSKGRTKLAWLVCIDAYRTPTPLSFPPHVMTFSAIYTSCLLALNGSDRPSSDAHNAQPSDDEQAELTAIVEQLGNEGQWQTTYSASADSVDDVTHAILDMYITILSMPSSELSKISASPSPASPRETGGSSAVKSTQASPPTAHLAFPLSAHWTPQTLTELKIRLREQRPGKSAWSADTMTTGASWPEVERGTGQAEAVGLGHNDTTVRFIWN